jgi:hypothetical protein
MIPAVIICYNNWVYVKNTIQQLEKYNVYIIVMDNNSTDPDTIKYLKTLYYHVIFNTTNNGPWVDTTHNTGLYNSLPDKFILTDPDLQFNENLPDNFVDILSELSDIHQTYKIGFALDISDFDKMYQAKYIFGRNNIYEWEYNEHWKKRINDPTYEMYIARLDTTFCLVNKKCSNHFIRLAGNFTAKHLPWYIDNKLFNVYSNYKLNSLTTNISTISSIITNYTHSNYTQITKNNEVFFIKNSENVPFLSEIPLDQFFSKERTLVNIHNRTDALSIVMYGSRLCEKVYTNLNSDLIKDNCTNIVKFDQIPSGVNCIINAEITDEKLLDTLISYDVPMLIWFYYNNWNIKNLPFEKLKKFKVCELTKEYITYFFHT